MKKRILSMCLMLTLLVTSFVVPTSFASASASPVIDFGNYTNDTYTSQETGLDFTNSNVAIAEGTNASLKLSSVHKGGTPANAKAWVANGNAYVYAGNASQQAMLNLDVGDLKFTDIDKISFDVINPDAGRKRSMVSVLVGPGEQQAYMFAIDGDDWWSDYNKRTTRTYTPFVRKYDNYAYAGGVLATDFTYSGATLTADNSTAPTLSTGTDITWTYTGGTIRSICGPWDGGTNYFGKNYSKAHWDIEFDTDTNKVSWTVSLWSRDDEPTLMYTWSDSFTDEDLKSRMENMVYPIAMGVQTNALGYSNVKVYGSVKEVPTIYDYFTTSSSYTSSSPLAFTAGAQNTIIEEDTHKWVTSDVHYGNDASKSAAYINNNALYVYAGNASPATVALMDIGEEKFEKITKINFDVVNPNPNNRQASHVHLLVDNNQQKSYAFSMGTDAYWEDSGKRTTRMYTPYVRKYDNFSYSGGVNSSDYTWDGATLTADNTTAPTLTEGTQIQWSYTSNGNEIVITSISGPWDGGTNYFGYTYSKAHWEVTFNETTNEVAWTVTVTPYDSSKTAYTWSDSFIDEDLPERMANCKYPVALAVQTNTMGYSNIEVFGELAQNALIYDDFSSYSTSAHYLPANKLGHAAAYTAGNSPLLGGNWVVSDVVESDDSTAAYAYFGADGKIYMRGAANASIATVNYDLKDKKLKKLTRVTVDTAPNGTAGGRSHLNLFVNEDESSFYSFSVAATGNSQSWEGGRNETASVHSGTPFVNKFTQYSNIRDTAVANTATKIGTDTLVSSIGVISANYANFAENYTNAHWDIKIDEANNKISWKVTLSYSDGSSTSWEESVTDSNLSNMIANAKYPVALGAARNEMCFDELKIYGEYYETGVEISENNVISTLNPAEYDLENATLVTAFYDANGNMLKAEEIEATETASETYALEGATKVKAYLFDGDEKDAKLVDEFETPFAKDYTIPTAKVKVACVGDSLTEGHGANPATFKYPSVLQRLLGYEYEVKNFGKGGHAVTDYDTETRPLYTSTTQYTESLAYNPDIVVIMLGANDVYEVTNADTSERFYTMYKELVETYKDLESNPEIYLLITTIDKWSVDNVNLWQKDKISKIAQELDVNLVDMRSIITDSSLLSDSVHFTNKGYNVLANEIKKALTQNINKLSYNGNQITINSHTAILGDVYAAGYNGDTLTSVVKLDGPVLSAVDSVIDISEINAQENDIIKVFFWNGNLTPKQEISKSFAAEVLNEGTNVTVKGRTNVPYKDALVVAYDANGEISYIGYADTNFDSVYNETFVCNDASSIYVNGSKIK